MLSYAQEVKNELSRKFEENLECLRTELIALLKYGAREENDRTEFINLNAAVARRVIKLSKKFLPDCKFEIAADHRRGLRYIVRFLDSNKIQEFIKSFEIMRRLNLRVAYLRGVFLACGTVNRPETQYFLGINLREKAEAFFVQKRLSALGFNAGIYKRKKEYVIWFREADSICDFLSVIGAEKAVERFEIARNIKEIRIQVNRLVNFETASLNRSISTAQQQLEDIKILINRNVSVNSKMCEAMLVRLENPECSVRELAEKMSISRSSLMYRLKKIHQLSEKYR